jgi:hypothetical protein
MAPAGFRVPRPAAQHRPRLSGARGAINSLMAVVVEDHILNHML